MKLTLVLLATLLGAAFCWPPDKPVSRNKLPHKVVCYWGTWAFYRDGVDGKFEPESINPHLCTHINYGFAKLDGNKMALFDPDLDTGDEDWNSGLTWGHGMIRRLNELRKYNPNLANIISIGGWNEGSDKYSAMVSSAAHRAEFVKSAMDFIEKYEFDGLDLDWEYPGMKAVADADRVPTGPTTDKANYVALLQELRKAFDPHGYILTAAVSAGQPTIDRAYDVPALSKNLDFINLMTYDFHGGWDNKTAHNAPLHPLPGATGIDLEYTVDYAVDYWIKLGADPHKLVLGIPLYGRSFTLASSANSGIGAPVTGKGGDAGQITKTIGMLGYNEICKLLETGWTTHWDDPQSVPYATHASQWIGYDDVKSVQAKVDYALSKKLGGGMIWSIDTDDFTGHCGKGKYPLLKTISKAMINVDGPDTTIPRTHATTGAPADPNQPTAAPPTKGTQTQKPTTGNSGTFKCPGVGFYVDPKDAHKFYQCVSNGSDFKAYPFDCPPGTTFDNAKHVCT